MHVGLTTWLFALLQHLIKQKFTVADVLYYFWNELYFLWHQYPIQFPDMWRWGKCKKKWSPTGIGLPLFYCLTSRCEKVHQKTISLSSKYTYNLGSFPFYRSRSISIGSFSLVFSYFFHRFTVEIEYCIWWCLRSLSYKCGPLKALIVNGVLEATFCSQITIAVWLILHPGSFL